MRIQTGSPIPELGREKREQRVQLKPTAILDYLDRSIRSKVAALARGDATATYYLDAFRSIRTELFGDVPENVGVRPPKEGGGE